MLGFHMSLAIQRLPTLSFHDLETSIHHSTIWGRGDLVTEEWQEDVRFYQLGMPLEQVRGCLKSLNQSGQSSNAERVLFHILQPCYMITDLRSIKTREHTRSSGRCCTCSIFPLSSTATMHSSPGRSVFAHLRTPRRCCLSSHQMVTSSSLAVLSHV